MKWTSSMPNCPPTVGSKKSGSSNACGVPGGNSGKAWLNRSMTIRSISLSATYVIVTRRPGRYGRLASLMESFCTCSMSLRKSSAYWLASP